MEQAQPASSALLRWVKVGILGAVLLLCFATIVILGIEVNRKINDQASASSDNIQWTLSQLEVEHLRLDSAVLAAMGGTGDLKEVRRRFDILYSRISTFRTGRLYAELRNDLLFAQPLAAMASMMDRNTPLIDGDDVALTANLFALHTELEQQVAAARMISLQGLEHFAGASDQSRREVWLTLLRVAALTVALVMALIVLSVVLFQLYRVAQRNTEESRAVSSRLEAMVNSTLDAVIVINEAGRIVEFNGSAEQIFGFTRAEAIDAPLVDLIIPHKYRRGHLEGMKRHMRDGSNNVVGRGRVQMEALRKSGEVFPCEFSIARARSTDGILFVSFLRDNSAQVAAEQELLKARDEALAGERTKAEFLAVMSHEMRTPLNGMLGTMELLGETGLNERQRDYLKIMETSGRLLLHHVNDVLDIARLDSGKRDSDSTPFGLDAVVTEVLQSLRAIAHGNRTSLEVDTSALGNPTVLGDAQRLRQVLLNLVSNAIKFTRDGVVRIEAEQIGSRDLVEFRVIDTGIGIAEEDLDRIFNDFVTLDTSYARESGGTGLGLGIARRLVESMQGSIGVESEVGEGSLFWFRIPLPILSSAPPEKEVEQIVPASASRPLDILVVEDNHINQLVVEEMLTKEGHKVTLANDGQEGVAVAALKRYDVILMDISMPRMDGVAACRAIRAGDGSSRNSRIIALTAHALPSDIERFREAGMNDALLKPISRSTLSRVLNTRNLDHDDLPVAAKPVPLPAPAPAPVDEADDDFEPTSISEDALGSLMADLGEELGLRLLSNFVRETGGVVQNLMDSADMSDADLIAMIHKLAGSASMFGTTELSGLLRSLEATGKNGDTAKMRRDLMQVEDVWKVSHDELLAIVPDLEEVADAANG